MILTESCAESFWHGASWNCSDNVHPNFTGSRESPIRGHPELRTPQDLHKASPGVPLGLLLDKTWQETVSRVMSACLLLPLILKNSCGYVTLGVGDVEYSWFRVHRLGSCRVGGINCSVLAALPSIVDL